MSNQLASLQTITTSSLQLRHHYQYHRQRVVSKNTHYYWSYGYDASKYHTSSNYKFPKPRHQTEAIRKKSIIVVQSTRIFW